MSKRRLKIPRPILRLSVLTINWLLNCWMSTLSLRVHRYNANSDPADANYSGPAIFVFWHEYILLPVYIRPHCGLTILTSQHPDADIISLVANKLGMEVIRGSTYRGAITALRQLFAEATKKSLAIVPDGPRGPRRQLAQGCVFLSSRLQVPIVLAGVGYDRPWRFQRAWDKFAVPKPFSRARIVLGPRIQVPAKLDRDDLEGHRAWLEQKLNELTQIAESWAENQFSLENSMALFPQSGRRSKRSVLVQTEDAAVRPTT